jgi:prophage regulatory protein
MNDRVISAIRFIRYDQLKTEKGIPFSRVHIDRLEKLGRFPRRVRLGANTVAWREDEVDGWTAARQSERRPARTEQALPRGPRA